MANPVSSLLVLQNIQGDGHGDWPARSQYILNGVSMLNFGIISHVSQYNFNVSKQKEILSEYYLNIIHFMKVYRHNSLFKGYLVSE